MAALTVAAAAVVCAAHFLNLHPHVIRDGEDAKNTALSNWDATFSAGAARTPREFAFQKSIYEASREGRLWHLFPRLLDAPPWGRHPHLD